MWNSYIIIICIILIILIINSRYTEDKMLNGFWRADADFCLSAGLEEFIIYFQPTEYIFYKSGYILAKSADGFVINNPVRFRMTTSNISCMAPYATHRCFTLTIDWLDASENEYFPSVQTLDYYFSLGKIIMGTDHIYGILYKDNYMNSTTENHKIPDKYNSNVADMNNGIDADSMDKSNIDADKLNTGADNTNIGVDNIDVNKSNNE